MLAVFVRLFMPFSVTITGEMNLTMIYGPSNFEVMLAANCENFDPNARRLTKLEPNEIFNDFAISREPFDEIDSNFFILKVWTKK